MFYICLFVALLKALHMPDICTLFCLVQIKKHSYLTTCVFRFETKIVSSPNLHFYLIWRYTSWVSMSMVLINPFSTESLPMTRQQKSCLHYKQPFLPISSCPTQHFTVKDNLSKTWTRLVFQIHKSLSTVVSKNFDPSLCTYSHKRLDRCCSLAEGGQGSITWVAG